MYFYSAFISFRSTFSRSRCFRSARIRLRRVRYASTAKRWAFFRSVSTSLRIPVVLMLSLFWLVSSASVCEYSMGSRCSMNLLSTWSRNIPFASTIVIVLGFMNLTNCLAATLLTSRLWQFRWISFFWRRAAIFWSWIVCRLYILLFESNFFLLHSSDTLLLLFGQLVQFILTFFHHSQFFFL